MSSFLSDPADIFGNRAARQAAELGVEASELGTAELRRQFDIQQARTEPFFKQAAPAIDILSQFSGAQGKEAQARQFEQFKASPGQAFLRKRGMDAASSAMKQLGAQDPNVLAALSQEGGDIAAQGFQEHLNRLASVAGIAQTTGAQLGQSGQQFATQFGQNRQNQANIQAQGIQNQQQANMNQLGQVAQLFGAFGGGG